MGFYEDERIRNKNKPVTPSAEPPKQPVNLILGGKRSLAEVLDSLKDSKFVVSLRGKNTVVIE